MTFVYPVLLGGMVFAGLPILLHLLIRQKPRTLLFPAMQFLMQKQRTNTRKLRLRHLLLMLLRVGLLVLLCLGLARPRLFHEQMGLSRERPVALVLVFDTSPSMDYRSNETTRLELAKTRALDLMDSLPEECRILIVDSAEPTGTQEWLQSLDRARQKLKSLAIQPRNAPVTQAILQAIHQVDEWVRQGEDPVGQGFPRFICVFTDRTRGSWDQSQANRISEMLQRETDMKLRPLLFDAGVEKPIDLAITHLELPATPEGTMRQAFAEGETIPLRAVVRATGQGHANALLCKVGSAKLQQAFDVQANESQAVTFEIDSSALGLRPGFHQAELSLESATDALSFNNQRYVTFQIRDKQRMLVIADNVQKARTFERALAALLYSVDVKSTEDKVDLSTYTTVFLEGVAAPSDELWQRLATYVQQGGGLGIVLPGDDLRPGAYNSEAAQKVMPGRIVGKRDSVRGVSWDPLAADLQHPFLAPFRAWFQQGNNDIILSPCLAYHYWNVAPPSNAADVAVLMTYDDDRRRPAVIERQKPKGVGKVLLLTTPMDEQQPEWNNYPRSLNSFYVGLTMLFARYLGNQAEDPTLNFVFGEEPPTMKRPVLGYSRFLLTGPNFSEEIRFQDEPGWTAARLPLAGNYQITGSNGDKQDTLMQFSINAPTIESDLSRVAVADVESALGQDCVIPCQASTSGLDFLHDLWNEPLDLFPWLMLAVLFFFAFETLLANRFYRQDAEPAAFPRNGEREP